MDKREESLLLGVLPLPVPRPRRRPFSLLLCSIFRKYETVHFSYSCLCSACSVCSKNSQGFGWQDYYHRRGLTSQTLWRSFLHLHQFAICACFSHLYSNIFKWNLLLNSHEFIYQQMPRKVSALFGTTHYLALVVLVFALYY